MIAFPWALAPRTWNRYQLRHLGRLFGGGTPNKESLSYWGGNIPWVSPKDMKERTIEDAEDHVTELGVRSSATRIVPKGSLLIVVRSGILQRTIPVALLGRAAALNQDMKALVPGDRVDVRFLVYWIDGLQNALLPLWRKEGATVESLDVESMRRAVLPLPPIGQQNAICDALDRKTAAIDELIRKKGRLIELLQEKRQALITQAVTKGLDPNVPMKSSGVDWIGRIPRHWEVVRIGLLARILNGSTPSRSETRYWAGGTIPWISSGKVNDYVVSEADECITHAALNECPLKLLPAQTVLVGMIGQGKTRGMSAITAIPACINQNTAGIVVGVRVKPKFVLNVLTAAYEPLREFGRGGQQDALNCEIIGAFPVPVPPPSEQDAINIRLTAEVGNLDQMKVAFQHSIDLLREYRQALITATVTGQLNIPAEAA